MSFSIFIAEYHIHVLHVGLLWAICGISRAPTQLCVSLSHISPYLHLKYGVVMRRQGKPANASMPPNRDIPLRIFSLDSDRFFTLCELCAIAFSLSAAASLTSYYSQAYRVIYCLPADCASISDSSSDQYTHTKFLIESLSALYHSTRLTHTLPFARHRHIYLLFYWTSFYVSFHRLVHSKPYARIAVHAETFIRRSRWSAA